MKLYGAQGVSPQVLLAYALSHGYQLSPPPALASTPLGKTCQFQGNWIIITD